jgi:hypothetical protein
LNTPWSIANGYHVLLNDLKNNIEKLMKSFNIIFVIWTNIVSLYGLLSSNMLFDGSDDVFDALFDDENIN